MRFTFRPQLTRQVKSYAANTPHCTERTLDCSLGVNPYGAPAAAAEALRAFSPEHLQDYPHSPVLHRALEAYWQAYTALPEEELTLANGSVCGLYVLNNVYAQTERRKVVGFFPTFTDMVESARSFGMEFCGVSARMDENGRMNTDDLIAAIDGGTALVYVDRPNNPTGQVLSLPDMEKVLCAARDAGCYVLADEAYGDFLPRQESAMTLRARYDNLIVLRTFSKGFGLANLRCGYIAAAPEVSACMRRTLNPYILGDLHRQVCAAALTDEGHPTAHAQEFSDAKAAIAAVCGEGLAMLTTDGRVPICTLTLRGSGDLQALLMAHDVLTVSGREFDALDERSVRLRVPTAAYVPQLTEAVAAVARSL